MSRVWAKQALEAFAQRAAPGQAPRCPLCLRAFRNYSKVKLHLGLETEQCKETTSAILLAVSDLLGIGVDATAFAQQRLEAHRTKVADVQAEQRARQKRERSSDNQDGEGQNRQTGAQAAAAELADGQPPKRRRPSNPESGRCPTCKTVIKDARRLLEHRKKSKTCKLLQQQHFDELAAKDKREEEKARSKEEATERRAAIAALERKLDSFQALELRQREQSSGSTRVASIMGTVEQLTGDLSEEQRAQVGVAVRESASFDPAADEPQKLQVTRGIVNAFTSISGGVDGGPRFDVAVARVVLGTIYKTWQRNASPGAGASSSGAAAAMSASGLRQLLESVPQEMSYRLLEAHGPQGVGKHGVAAAAQQQVRPLAKWANDLGLEAEEPGGCDPFDAWMQSGELCE